MSQQISALTNKHIPGTFINSDLGPDEKKIRYSLLRDGVLKFLYCTPERFDSDVVRPAEIAEISRARPSYLVVDEAHCIDRWGNDFRPNYGRLGEVRKKLGSPPVLAFTATAGVESQQRILQSLGIPKARVIVTGVNRHNISLARLDVVQDKDRYRLIAGLLTAIPTGRAMLFVPTVKLGEQLRAGLQNLGYELPFYHSRHGTANDRDMLLGRFTGRLSPPLNAVICTSAFGMGLDVPDVRLVVHWQHPASVEDYLQEFGRAGRDGKASVAVLFTSTEDEGLLRYMAERTIQEAPTSEISREEALEARYRAIAQMQRQATNRDACFREMIVRFFGENASTTKRSLALRIVEWIFQKKRRVPKTERCCDYCDAVTPGNVLAWARFIFLKGKLS